MRLYAAVAVAAAGLVAAAAIVLLDGGDDPQDVFAAKPADLDERVKRARLTLGSDLHPTVRVVANGAEIPILDDIGTGKDPSPSRCTGIRATSGYTPRGSRPVASRSGSSWRSGAYR